MANMTTLTHLYSRRVETEHAYRALLATNVANMTTADRIQLDIRTKRACDEAFAASRAYDEAIAAASMPEIAKAEGRS